VWNSDPGQNQKAHIISQEFKICLSCPIVPADKVIPGGHSSSPEKSSGQREGRLEENQNLKCKKQK